ncbi:fungal trichothecene efflux pump-domain-containing protein [Dendryphion nanum]|uniref:Fungal trichothecene efflux pump-domain-containing protein n=1 Tax=Dendryphion nanum TaxID=256645 RepID=A0A9P9IRS2_9PLEO|nr:fungal trichothecene efflux pump-domain-containing protein [Dendryphion nanum]
MSDKTSEAERIETTAKHDHHHDTEKYHHDDAAGANLELSEDALPPGYFTSKFFLGTMAGIGLGLMAGDPNIVWVALSYTLTSAVTLTIIGRVSDIFGRRWIFVGGAALGVLGAIICAVAQNVTTLIVGTTIMGIAAATQLSYFYVMGELVPMKYRLAGNAFCYLFCIPGSGVAPEFDYVGTLLYTGGLLIFMMGLSWGGSVYPWSSAYVIATIVVGLAALVAFVCYECFVDLKEPLVPMHIFSNYSWNASVILTGLGASVYYAFAIVWPSMVAVLYSDGGVMNAAWLSSLVGLCITIGQIVGGFSGKKIGHLKWQCVVGIILGAACFGAMASCGVGTKTRASALLSFGVFFIGWTEGAAITIVTLAAKDQFALGTSAGVAGSIRFLISSIASTVYTVILSNRLTTTIAAQVPSAVIGAGLPASSVASFIAAFSLGPAAFEKIPGISAEIIAVGTSAYQHANADAYRTIFFSNIAFSGVAIICSLLLPNVDHLLTGQVATTLHQGRDEKTIAGEK